MHTQIVCGIVVVIPVCFHFVT